MLYEISILGNKMFGEIYFENFERIEIFNFVKVDFSKTERGCVISYFCEQTYLARYARIIAKIRLF